jgi:hypothetical protein
LLRERTVASHLTHIYAKLGVRSRTELVGQLLSRAPISPAEANKVPTSWRFLRMRRAHTVPAMPSYSVEPFPDETPRRRPSARAASNHIQGRDPDIGFRPSRAQEIASSTTSPLVSSDLRRPVRDQAVEPAQMIEEYAGIDVVPVTGRTEQWLWLAITLGIAIVGFGFAGHIWRPPGVASVESSAPTSIGQVPGPSPTPVVALTVLTPSENTPFGGETVSVFEASSATVAGSTSVRLRRFAASGQFGNAVGLLVDGFAPSNVEAMTVDIRTNSGSLLASTVVPSVGEERPGSGGGPRVGIGSLGSQLVVPGPIPPDGWQVRITWRDRSNGLLGSVVQRIPAVTLGRNPAPFQ